MALNSLKWRRAVKQSRSRLLPSPQQARSRNKGTVVSYTAGVSLIVTLEDGVVECPAHLTQCGGTPYVPAVNDVVFVDNVGGSLVVIGKYIL